MPIAPGNIRAPGKFDGALPWLFAALGFTIPIGTAPSNLFFALVVLTALALPERRARLVAFLTHPVARAALLLFALLTLGCLHGDAPLGDRLRTLWKYADLLLIGLLIPLLALPEHRYKALLGFMAAQGLTLALSTLFWLGVLPDGKWRIGDGTASATIFKLHIQQSWLMALFAFACFVLAGTSHDRRWRWGLYGLCALAVTNILFMVQGRTGYAVLAVLIVLACFMRFRWRGLFVAAALGGLLGSAGLHFSPQLTSGITRAVNDVRTWDPAMGAQPGSSQGLRLDYWYHSLPVVLEHAALGAGTGSFRQAFAKQVEGTKVVRTTNPHQQFLLIGVEAGLPGLAALIFLFWTLWSAATRLPPARRDMVRGLAVATAAGCLFNSFLHDHTEGMFFAWAIAALFGGGQMADASPADRI